MTQQVTKDNYNQFEKGIMLLDFWATWCGPCQALGPIIEELSGEYNGKLNFGKINVDEEPELAGKFEVMSIPTVIILKDGQEVKRIIGFGGKQKVVDAINEVVGVQASAA